MQQQRLLRLARQPDEIEFLECVLDGVHHRSAPDKLEDYVTHTRAAYAADLVEAADHAECLLNAAADVVFHLLRRGTGIFGSNG